jgi:WD40 repeat protein
VSTGHLKISKCNCEDFTRQIISLSQEKCIGDVLAIADDESIIAYQQKELTWVGNQYAHKGNLVVFDLLMQTEVASFVYETYAKVGIFADRNRTIITGDLIGTISVWDLNLRMLKIQYNPVCSPINSLALYNSMLYVSIQHKKTMKIDLESNKISYPFNYVKLQNMIEINDNGSYLVSSGLSVPMLWNLETLEMFSDFNAHKSPISNILVLNKANLIVTASLPEDCSVIFWDLTTKSFLHRIRDHRGCIGCMKTTPDEKYLLYGCEDRIARVVDMRKKEIIQRFCGHSSCVKEIHAVVERDIGISWESDGVLKCWKFRENKEIWTMKGMSDIKGIGCTKNFYMVLADSHKFSIWKMKLD